MTPLQIVALGVRLFALVWLLYTLSSLHQVFFYLGRAGGPGDATVWIFTLIQIGVCALLWFFPRTIAARLLPSRSAEQPVPAVSLAEWQTLGVILIALWALTRAVGAAIYWISLYNIVEGRLSDFGPEQKAAMILTAAELAIGIWLLLGAKGIAAAIFKLRTAGIKD